jgi:intracellular sulfur oxidation DsrE/DsrF family protein
MPAKTLQIIESAYRGTIEEQDDPVVWITHAMKGAGGEMDVLLKGNAVNYAVKGQDASGLSFGDRKQTQPPRLDEDISRLAGKGVQVFVVQEDLSRRGIDSADLIQGLRPVPRSEVAKVFAGYDRIWHW